MFSIRNLLKKRILAEKQRIYGNPEHLTISKLHNMFRHWKR